MECHKKRDKNDPGHSDFFLEKFYVVQGQTPIILHTHTHNASHTRTRRHLGLDGVLPLGEVDGALALAVGGAGSLVLGKTAADLAGLLDAEVEGQVLLVLVEQTQLGALVGVDDGQDAGDGLADIVAVGEMLV